MFSQLAYLQISWNQVDLVRLGTFQTELGKNILFGIGNGGEIRPEILLIESPVYESKPLIFLLTSKNISTDLRGPNVKYKLHYGPCMGCQTAQHQLQ